MYRGAPWYIVSLQHFEEPAVGQSDSWERLKELFEEAARLAPEERGRSLVTLEICRTRLHHRHRPRVVSARGILCNPK